MSMGSLLLTAGASDGRLQLWKAPTDGKRGFELRQFVTSEKSDVTSAAFFDPTAAGEIRFAVTGAKDGIVSRFIRACVDEHLNNLFRAQKTCPVQRRASHVGSPG